MKPFILHSAEFNHKKMEVVANTDCGVFGFPVLPPLENQKESYTLVFEDGNYVIRTVDHNRLRRGDYGPDEEINLFHEVCHCDRRVILPRYSYSLWFQEKLEKEFNHSKLDEDKQKLLEIAKLYTEQSELGNVLEDLLTVGVLRDVTETEVNEIVRILKINRRIKEMIEFFRLLMSTMAPDANNSFLDELSPQLRIEDFLKLYKIRPSERIVEVSRVYFLSDLLFVTAYDMLTGNLSNPNDVSDRLKKIFRLFCSVGRSRKNTRVKFAKKVLERHIYEVLKLIEIQKSTMFIVGDELMAIRWWLEDLRVGLKINKMKRQVECVLNRGLLKCLDPWDYFYIHSQIM